MLESLSEKMDVELVVSPVGNAMILHRGALEHNYSWAQYEPQKHSVELVTEEGLLQPLGFEVNSEMEKPLLNTLEIMLVQMTEDNKAAGAKLIKFAALGE